MRIHKVILVCIWTSLVTMSCAKINSDRSKLTEAGFHSNANLPTELKAPYQRFASCGSVKIHKDKPIYLSALHCLHGTKDVEMDGFTEIGPQINREFLYKFPDYSGKTSKNGRKILANGRCYTGFAIDALSNEKDEEKLKLVTDCLNGDWIIYEDKQAQNANENVCAVTSLEGLSSGDKVTAIGSPTSKVTRHEITTQLDGQVFSQGETLAIDFVDSEKYKFSDKWTDLMVKNLRKHLDNKDIFVSDADVIQGMSGGPVFLSQDKKLGGVTTVAMVPNFGALELEVYYYATHVGVTIKSIQSQLDSPNEYFDCDN